MTHTPYPEEKRIENIARKLRALAKECRERAVDYDALANDMEKGCSCERCEQLLIQEALERR